MELEIGKSYADKNSRVYKIQGPTKHNPEWVYSLCGFWFEKSTGYHIDSRKSKSGERGQYISPLSYRSLVREVKEHD